MANLNGTADIHEVADGVEPFVEDLPFSVAVRG